MASQTVPPFQSSTGLSTKCHIALDMFDTIVQIEVGPTPIKFYMHKGLLCNASPYFRAALEGGFIETQEQRIELQEEDPSMFKRFQLWLYTGCLLETSPTANDTVDWGTLIDLYIFAEVRGIAALQNATMDKLLGFSYKGLGLCTLYLHRIYAGTCEGSPLRRLNVELMTTGSVNLSKRNWQTEVQQEHYPKEFLCDVVSALYGKLPAEYRDGGPLKVSREDLHVPVATSSPHLG